MMIMVVVVHGNDTTTMTMVYITLLTVMLMSRMMKIADDAVTFSGVSAIPHLGVLLPAQIIRQVVRCELKSNDNSAVSSRPIKTPLTD